MRRNFSYIEVIFITLIYIFIGLYLSPEDPLFIDSKVTFFPLFLTIITLFYGSRHGVLSLMISTTILYFYYKDEILTLFLSNLLFILIVGQFFYYWYNKHKKSQDEFEYIMSRFNELSHSFYALKISHNILEKSYTLKPQSLRASIDTLRDQYLKNRLEYSDFLKLLNREFFVQSSLIAVLKRGKFKTLSSTKDGNRVVIDDILVQKALLSTESSYIDKEQFDLKDSRYLAVIPVKDHKDSVTALLAIEKMPFLEFNQNSIINISIIFSYFMDQINISKSIKELGYKKIDDEAIFAYHYRTLETLYKRYKRDSTVIVFKVDDKLIERKLLKSLDRSLRGVDRYYRVDTNSIILLLPFTPKEASENIVNNLIKVSKLRSDELEFMRFGVAEKELIYRYIKES